MTIAADDYAALDRLTAAYHENARNKGFTELHDRLNALVALMLDEDDRLYDPELAQYLVNIEAGNELMLIVTELGEAHEQIRTSPYRIDQTYYVDEDGNTTLERFAPDGTMRKPEGYPSEIADVQIRIGDTVGRRHVVLGEGITREKAEYNATRAQRHGGKKF